jgi:hypothetical protein
MNEKEQEKENSIRKEQIVDNYSDSRASQIAQVITTIENVGLLTADQLVIVSRRLYKLVRFCDCIRIKSVERKDGTFDGTSHHECHKFNPHDHQHLPYCRCCQTRAFGYYLAWSLDGLAREARLPEYNIASLSVHRIRDRTYGYIKCRSNFKFCIWRHLNTFHQWQPQETVLQEWVFDLEKLTLIKSDYI